MTKVEQGVHAHFARLQQQEHQQQRQEQQNASCPPTPLPAMDDSATTSARTGLIETPFAKINSVAEGSPAAQAGIKVGDRIRSVGHVNWMNHENLAKVAEVVQRNEGVWFFFCRFISSLISNSPTYSYSLTYLH